MDKKILFEYIQLIFKPSFAILIHLNSTDWTIYKRFLINDLIITPNNNTL
jgi:hypothetical protein